MAYCSATDTSHDLLDQFESVPEFDPSLEPACFGRSHGSCTGIAIRSDNDNGQRILRFEQLYCDTSECGIRLLDAILVPIRCLGDECPDVVHHGCDGAVRIVGFVGDP